MPFTDRNYILLKLLLLFVLGCIVFVPWPKVPKVKWDTCMEWSSKAADRQSPSYIDDVGDLFRQCLDKVDR